MGAPDGGGLGFLTPTGEYQSSKSKVVTTLEDGRLCGWFVEVCPSPQDHGLDPLSSEGLYGGEVKPVRDEAQR